MNYDPVPKICNLCGGHVTLKVRNGIPLYECDSCLASVRTNPARKNQAVGILADTDTKVMRCLCHVEFDKMWRGKKNEKAARDRAYKWLSKKLGLERDECHFGLMTKEKLKEAYRLLKTKEG